MKVTAASLSSIPSDKPATAPASWGLVGISLVMFMAGLDSNIVHVALPTLARSLHEPFGAVQWVVLSYLLVTTAIMAGAGRLGDMFGKKRVFAAGTAVFTLGSLLCGLSSSITTLVAARVLQGVGGALSMALSYALASDLVAKERVGHTIGVMSTIASIGMTAGPTVGGLLLTWFGWQSLFLVNVPLGVLAYWLMHRFVQLDEHPKRMPLDVTGMGLMATWVTCYALGLTWIETDGLANAQVLGLLAAAALVLTGFVAYEKRISYPFLNPTVLRHKPLNLSLLAGLLMHAAVVATSIVLTFYLTGAKHYSPAQVGLILSTGPLTTALLSTPAGRISDQYGARPVMLTGAILLVLGCASLTQLSLLESTWSLIARLLALNLGFTFFRTPNNMLVITLAPAHERGLVGGLLSQARTLGQITGAALVGAVFALLIRRAGFANVNDASPAALVSGTHYAFLLTTLLALAATLLIYSVLRLEQRTR